MLEVMELNAKYIEQAAQRAIARKS
jgi:hypothetical protein